MRKAALRDQVRAGGELAVTVFAADKLSDIIGLRRGIGQSGQAIEERIGTTIAGIAGHYSESVELIIGYAAIDFPAGTARAIGSPRGRVLWSIGAAPGKRPDRGSFLRRHFWSARASWRCTATR